MAQIGASGFVTQPPALPLTDELPASSQSTLLLQKKKEMAEVRARAQAPLQRARSRDGAAPAVAPRCSSSWTTRRTSFGSACSVVRRRRSSWRRSRRPSRSRRAEPPNCRPGTARTGPAASDALPAARQVRKFDKFLKDNDAKRMRANRKALEEVKLREQKETEKQQLVKELGVQQQKKEELQVRAARRRTALPPRGACPSPSVFPACRLPPPPHAAAAAQEERERKAVYESFLERLCELTEYFEDIDTVLKRYFTLDAANQDLRTRVEVAQTSSEELTGMLSAFTKSTQARRSIVSHSATTAPPISLHTTALLLSAAPLASPSLIARARRRVPRRP